MEGYYDYYPRVIPDFPIAVAGLPGARVPVIGAAISALTGLPLVELDRLIEHLAGMSLSLLLIEQGEAALSELQTRALERALDTKPQGIITLGDGALSGQKNRQLVRQRARLVYVELSIFELFARLKEEILQSPGKYFHVLPNPPENPHDLRPLLDRRLADFHAAALTINGSHKHPTQIAQEIIDAFGLQADA